MQMQPSNTNTIINHKHIISNGNTCEEYQVLLLAYKRPVKFDMNFSI
jgi:hypothetical protein